MQRKEIAIIGSGISGLTCGHLLAPHHNITLFEAADYIGGHTHTVRVEKGGEISDIDTGFIVFNDRTYPAFMSLMDRLGVSYQPTEMSFSVTNPAINLEYNGNNLNTLFAQRSNLLRPEFWWLIREILRFNGEVRKTATEKGTVTVGQFLDKGDYTELFRDNYLLPMISAIWSMGLDSCREFPLQFFVRFFENHGLLDLVNRPQWYTIVGGSSKYIEPLINSFADRIFLDCPVRSVRRLEDSVLVTTDSQSRSFDEVVFACHADQALAIIEDPVPEELAVLGKFTTSLNEVILHTDTRFLPKRRLAWASWNHNVVDGERQQTTLTYNMNILQRLEKKHTYLVSLNQDITEKHILQRFNYRHPVYTQDAIAAQQQWQKISGRNNTHFCGAYWFNGFHEDGVQSGLRVCNSMGVS